MIQSSSTETVDACLAAAERGMAWLLDQQTAAGSWRQLEAEVFDAYYKGGWALAVSGQPAAAHRLLTHVHARSSRRRATSNCARRFCTPTSPASTPAPT